MFLRGDPPSKVVHAQASGAGARGDSGRKEDDLLMAGLFAPPVHTSAPVAPAAPAASVAVASESIYADLGGYGDFEL